MYISREPLPPQHTSLTIGAGLKVRSHQARRNWDYLETPWGPGGEDAEASGEGWRTEGNVRAVQFCSSGFGIVYATKVTAIMI